MIGSSLVVSFEDREVGEVVQASPGRLSFRYVRAWLEGRDTFAISQSLPLTSDRYDEAGQRFFANLLPEGDVRTAVARRLGVSVDNDFELLSALGRECAGALVVAPTGEAHPSQDGYRTLSKRELSARLREPSGFAALVGDDVRLSLAGAQDKLAVELHGEELRLPLGHAPTTHILKDRKSVV